MSRQYAERKTGRKLRTEEEQKQQRTSVAVKPSAQRQAAREENTRKWNSSINSAGYTGDATHDLVLRAQRTGDYSYTGNAAADQQILQLRQNSLSGYQQQMDQIAGQVRGVNRRRLTVIPGTGDELQTYGDAQTFYSKMYNAAMSSGDPNAVHAAKTGWLGADNERRKAGRVEEQRLLEHWDRNRGGTDWDSLASDSRNANRMQEFYQKMHDAAASVGDAATMEQARAGYDAAGKRWAEAAEATRQSYAGPQYGGAAIARDLDRATLSGALGNSRPYVRDRTWPASAAGSPVGDRLRELERDPDVQEQLYTRAAEKSAVGRMTGDTGMWVSGAMEAARAQKNYTAGVREQSRKQAEEEWLQSLEPLKEKDLGQYTALTMSPEEIQRELDRENQQRNAYIAAEQQQYSGAAAALSWDDAQQRLESTDEMDARIAVLQKAQLYQELWRQDDEEKRIRNNPRFADNVASGQAKIRGRANTPEAQELRRRIEAAREELDSITYRTTGSQVYDPEADNDTAVLQRREQLEADLEAWQAEYDRLTANYDLSSTDANGRERDENSALTEDQEQIYYALYNEDPARASEYAERCRKLNLDAYYAGIYDKWNDGNFFQRTGAFFAGTGAKILSGGSALLTGVDSNETQRWSRIGSSILEAGSEGFSQAGQFLYNTASSMVSSGITAAPAWALGAAGAPAWAVSLGEWAGLGIMGGSAAADDYANKIRQGWDEGAAKAHALCAGAWEIVTEKISLDRLIDPDLAGGALRALGTQGFIEGTEEGASNLLNTVSDAYVSRLYGYQSEIDSQRNELMSTGMSYQDANRQVADTWAKELFMDTLGGVISGVGMGGASYVGKSAVNRVRENRAQTRAGQQLAGTGAESALRQYATDNGLEWNSVKNEKNAPHPSPAATPSPEGEGLRGPSEGEGSAGDGGRPMTAPTEEGSAGEQSKRAKLSRRAARKTYRSADAAAAHMQRQVTEAGTVTEAAEKYDELLQQYGTDVKGILDRAIQDKTMELIRQSGDNVNSLIDVVKGEVDRIGSERARNAAREALNYAVYVRKSEAASRMSQAQQRQDPENAEAYRQQVEAGEAYLRRGGRNATMEHTVIGEDGTRSKVAIVGMTEDRNSVKLANGDTVAVQDLNTDADTKDVLGLIPKTEMTGAAANDMLGVFQAEKNAGMVSDAFRWGLDYITAYSQGRQNAVSLQQAQKQSSLSGEAVKLAYNAGAQAAEAMDAKAQARVDEALRIANRGATGRAGSVTVDNAAVAAEIDSSPAIKRETERIRKMAEAFGVDVGLYSSQVTTKKIRGKERQVYTGENGRYQDGKIWLDIHAGKNFVEDTAVGMVQTMAHEMTHFLQEYNPGAYKGVRQFALSQIVAQKGQRTLDRLVQEKISRHTGKEQLSLSLAEDEVVADFCQDLLTDKAALETMAKENPTGFQALVEWVKDFLAKIKEKLSGSAANSEELQIYRAMEQSLKDAFGEAWGKGIVGAVQTHDTVGSLEKGNKNTAREGGGQRSERDYPIDVDVQIIVSNALAGNANGSFEIGTISKGENSVINRFENTRGGYSGRFTGGKHIVTNTAIRHAIGEHGNVIREALRAQLPLTAEDLARTITAIKNGQARIVAATSTSMSNRSILQAVEVNGYTLYAEELLGRKSDKVRNLINHTTYKAPTLSTADGLTTSVNRLPRRQSGVLYEKSIPQTGQKSTSNFVADRDGNAALLYYAVDNGVLIHDRTSGGLVLASSDIEVVKANAPGATIKQGFIRMQNPFVITQNNTVFTNSDTNVSDVVGGLRSSGNDGFIFDYHTGDNYAVMFFRSGQVVDDLSGWEKAAEGIARNQDRSYDMPSDTELLEEIDESGLKGDEKAQVREAKQKQQKIRDLERQLARVRNELKGLEGENPSRLSVKDFTRNVLDLFGIPTGSRTEAGEMLQSIAYAVLSGQQLSREDAEGFFSYFLSQGKGRMVADESLVQIRDELKGRRIYVNQETRADFGDDWNAFRKRAFGLGIQLTSNENNMGVDSVNAELAEMFPGSFDTGATDLRSMLENMVDTAESGKASDVSLLEAMEETAKQTGEPVQAQLQAMMDSFLRHLDIMQDRARIEAKARAGNAQELAKAKNRAAQAAAELSKARKERNDWKRKATGAEARQAKAVDRALRGVIQHDAKQLAEAVRQKEALAKRLEKQLQREEDILSGKLRTPALTKLLNNARETASKEMAAHKDEVFANRREQQKQAQLRGRIDHLKQELQRRLSNPSDRSYIPAGLAMSLVEVLDSVDNRSKPGTKAAERQYSTAEKLRALAEAYEGIKNDPDVGWEFQVEYDEEIRNQIKALANTMQGRNLRALTSEELQQVYDTVRQVRDILRDATKTLSGIQFKSLYDAMGSVAEQQRGMRGINAVSKHQKAKRLRLLDNLSVMRAVEMMSGWDRSSALYQLMQAVEQGTVESDRWVMDYNKSLLDLKTGKNEKAYRDALTKQLDYGVTDEDGLTVKMTKLQALQILMTAEREAHNENLVHLQKGGAVIRDALAIQDGKAAKAKSQTIQVTPEFLQKIRDSLTEWDRSYMQAIRQYFAREGRAANRVHYLLKHKVLQTEEYYTPYIVDKNYLDAKLDEQGAMTMWVKSPGSTNALKTQSPKPVIIDGMDTVMAKHVKEIGDYIGLALPIRDFSKVYNGRLHTDGANPLPVKATIGKNFDAKGQHLLTQAIIDVQGGSRSASWTTAIAERLNWLQSAFVKSALLINPSVTIKQAASYSAAESVLSHAALIAGNRPLVSSQDASRSPSLIAQIFATPEGRTAQRIYNEIDRYTSMHYQRRLGMSQAELANEANRSGKVRRMMNGIGASMEQSRLGHAVRKGGEMLNPVTWIQRMDVATTAALWVACKEQARMDGMAAGTAEYWQHATELYERCLRETQPMYDGLHRSANQKQHEGIMQYLFPFRTVPIQNHGQIAASYEGLLAAKQSGDKARMREANKFFAKTVWSQTESAVVFSVMTFIAAALKRKTKKYRDEDEEADLWSVLKGIGMDTASTWFSDLFPVFGSELWSIGDRIYNKVSGKGGYTFDAFSVGAVDMLNSLAESGDKLFADAGKLMRGEEVPLDTLSDHALAMVLKAAKIAGIPADTVKTYWEGFKGNVRDLSEGRLPALNDAAADRAASLNAGRYWKAWTAGDDAKRNAVLREMRQNYLDDGKDPEKADELTRNALTGAAVDRYEAGDLDLDELAEYLAETGLWAEDKLQDKLAGIIRDDFKDGLRNQEETISALGRLAGIDENKAWQKTNEWEAKAAHAGDEDYSYSQYEDLADALDAGSSFEEAAAPYLEHGYQEENLRNAAVAHTKERFLAGDIAEDEAVELLQGYKDLDADEAWWKVTEWRETAEHEGEADYSWNKYGPIFEAVDRGGDISAAGKVLLQHGISQDAINNAVQGRILDAYAKGTVSEQVAIQRLQKYRGLTADEAYWAVDKRRSRDAAEQAGVEFTDSNYRDLYAAIDKNKDPAAAMRELTAHGYKERDIYGAAKDYLVDRFERGQITETALKNQLSRYAKVVNADMVGEIVTKAKCFKETGYRLSNLNETYLDGEISADKARSILTKYGGMSDTDAKNRIRWLDLRKQDPELEITEDRTNYYYDGTSKTKENGHESAKASGMTVQQYVRAMEVLSQVTGTDKDGNGKTDTNSKEIAYIAAIDGMNLTGRQKWALYYEDYKGANWKKIRKPNW